MPERGGPTTQSGILYQNSVTALHLGRLCDEAARLASERVIRVRVEAPENVDDTVVWYADSRVEYLQAKERIEVGDTAWQKLWKAFATQYSRHTFVRGRDRLILHISDATKDHLEVREICDRARSHEDPAEWQRALSERQEQLTRRITPLLAPTLTVDKTVLRGFFAHVLVKVWPRSEIERGWLRYWMPPANIEAQTLFGLLRDRVGGHARLRGVFTAQDLRADLHDEHRVDFRAAPDIGALLEAVRGCSALLRQHKATLGRTGLHFQRNVVGEIADWAFDRSVERRVGLLLDHAGRGKTVVVRDVLVELEVRGAAVLGIKADQQLSGVQDQIALQERLGLPEPIERVVSRLATRGPVVVIVDQVDALSLSLARDQHGLNAVLEMVARVSEIPGVAVILSCRTFDRNTDPRLKRVAVDREFPLPLLSEEEVATVLAELDIVPGALSAATRELLRTPLHLDLFASLATTMDGVSARLRGIGSLQDLYGLLWDEAVLPPTTSGVSAAAREYVLRAITHRMHHDQRTSVPRSILTALSNPEAVLAAASLASSGIVVEAQAELTFLHQSFFDYCYARFFVDDGEDLARTVLDSDQGLFTRSQVLHVLAYMRGNRHPAYMRTLQTLLDAPNLRFHLRDLVLRWIGAQPSPTDAEWGLIYRRLLDPEHRAHTMQAMGGNAAWLERLSGAALDGLLRGESSFLDENVIPYLASIANSDAQDTVADLVRPWLDREDPWPTRTHFVVQRIRSWRTPNAVALFEEFVDRLPLEQVRYLFELDDVAEIDSAAGCRLLRSLLDRILDAYHPQPTDHFEARHGLAESLEALNGSAGQKTLAHLSKTAPTEFLDMMLPWLEQAMVLGNGLTQDNTDYFYPIDSVSVGVVADSRVICRALVGAYVDALVGVARTDGSAFRRIASDLAGLPYTTPQTILARAYSALGHEYAVDALAFILGDARRLRLGERDEYESRMLLRAVACHLSADGLDALEQFVQSETGQIPPWYRDSASLRWRGADQLFLLRELSRDRLSAKGRKCLQELERKFPNLRASDSPRSGLAGWVGSPIPAENCALMSDSSWLKAMAKYAHGVEHEQFLRGGARQLSRVLEAQVKMDPTRFARLAESIPEDADDHYVDAFVNGLAESNCPPEWVYTVVRRFASPARPGVHRRVAWALGKVVERTDGLPADLLDLLEGWVREAPREDEAFYESQQQDLYHAALNSDRGAALHTLMFALSKDASVDALARRWALAEFVAENPSAVLRAGGLDALLRLLDVDQSRAIGLFEETVRDHPRLRSTDPFHNFLYYGSFGHFARLGPHIRDLMQADDAEARQRGAELAVLGALSPAGLEDYTARTLASQLAEEAINGAPELRQGAARIYAYNWADHPTGECEIALQRLFDDLDADVRRQAAWMTHKLRPEHVLTRQDFLLAFAASHAGRAGAHDFAEFLWEHGMFDPAWALAAAEALIGNRNEEDEHVVFTGHEELVRLVLRVYTDQDVDTNLREQAITLFDRLMDRFAGHALKALAEWDRS